MAKWTCSKHVIEYKGPVCPKCQEEHEKASKSRLSGGSWFEQKASTTPLRFDDEPDDRDL